MSDCNIRIAEIRPNPYSLYTWRSKPKFITLTSIDVSGSEAIIYWENTKGEKFSGNLNEFILNEVQNGDPNKVVAANSPPPPAAQITIVAIKNKIQQLINEAKILCKKKIDEKDQAKFADENSIETVADCDKCNDCYEKYKQAVGRLIAEVKAMVDNKIVGISGTTTRPNVGKVGIEPGCLEAPVSIRGATPSTEGQTQQVDILNIQPNSATTLSGFETTTTKKYKDTFKFLINDLCKKMGLGDSYDEFFEKFRRLNKYRLSSGKLRNAVDKEGKGTGSSLTKDYCSQISTFIKDNYNATDPNAEPSVYLNGNKGYKIEEQPMFDGFNQFIPTIEKGCCLLAIKEALDSMENNTGDGGPFGDIDTIENAAESYEKMGSGSTITLSSGLSDQEIPFAILVKMYNDDSEPKEGLACCAGDIKCPNLKCGDPSGNSSRIDTILGQLDKLSNTSGKGSSSCVNKLRKDIQNILYGENGLHSKFIRYMMVKKMLNWDVDKILHQYWVPGARSLPNTYANSCKALVETALNVQTSRWKEWPNTEGEINPFPDEPEKLKKANDWASFLNDCLFAQTSEQVQAGYEPTGVEEECDHCIIKIRYLDTFTFEGKNLALVYDNILTQIQKSLQDLIVSTLEDKFPDEEIPSPDKQKQQCDMLENLIDSYKDNRNRLQGELKIKKQQLIDLGKKIAELNNKKAGNDPDFPELPDDPDAKGKCLSFREFYKLLLLEINTIEKEVSDINNKITKHSQDIAFIRTNLEQTKKLIASINSMNTADQQRPATPEEIDVVNNTLSTIKRFGGRSYGTIPDTVTRARLMTWANPALTDLEFTINRLTQKIKDDQIKRDKLQETIREKRTKLAEYGEKIKKECKSDLYKDFDPLSKDKSDLSRNEVLDQQISAIQDQITALGVELADIESQIIYFDNAINDMVMEKSKLCPDGTPTGSKTIRGCFLDCVLLGIQNSTRNILALDLKRYLDKTGESNGTPCQGDKGDFPEGVPSPTQTGDGCVAPGYEFALNEKGDGNPGVYIFDAKVTATSVINGIKEIILSCINTGNPPKNNNGEIPNDFRNINCSYLEKLKKTLDDDKKIAETQYKTQRDAVPYRNTESALWTNLGVGDNPQFHLPKDLLDGYIDMVATNPIYSSISNNVSAMEEIKKLMKDALSGKNMTGSRTEEELIALGIIRIVTTIEKLAYLKKKFLEAEKASEKVDSALQACKDILKKGDSACTEILEKVRTQLGNLLNPNNPLWNQTYELIVNLLGDAPTDQNEKDPLKWNINRLKEEFLKEVLDWIDKQCPDRKDDGEKGFGETLFPGDQPRDPPYVKPGINDIRLYCIDNKWKAIGVTFRLKRFQFFGKDGDDKRNAGCFQKQIADWLNSTVICTEEYNWNTRRSIFHDFWEKLIFKAPNKDGPVAQIGAKWLPDITKPGDPEGPYYYPPPNTYQEILARQDPEKKGIRYPCPQDCTHIPTPEDPQKRWAILRRLFYEMNSVYDYLTNLENAVAAIKPVLQALKKGLEYCSDPKNKTEKEYVEASAGKGSLLDPAVHQRPPFKTQMVFTPTPVVNLTFAQAKEDAVIKAVTYAALNTNSCAPCSPEVGVPDPLPRDVINGPLKPTDPPKAPPPVKKPPVPDTPKPDTEPPTRQPVPKDEGGVGPTSRPTMVPMKPEPKD